ncbi:hypothetical protein LSAT2_005544 [Lamellibrachia satsuma]|nr:hypothetical protein LSAT2_005544 [Lamellibrachia satsuma]
MMGKIVSKSSHLSHSKTTSTCCAHSCQVNDITAGARATIIHTNGRKRTIEHMLAAGILLVVSTSMCTRRADAYGGTAYKYCLNRCNFFLFLCIRESCPGRKWPLPVPDECVEERTQCIVEECAKFSRSYG